MQIACIFFEYANYHVRIDASGEDRIVATKIRPALEARQVNGDDKDR